MNGPQWLKSQGRTAMRCRRRPHKHRTASARAASSAALCFAGATAPGDALERPYSICTATAPSNTLPHISAAGHEQPVCGRTTAVAPAHALPAALSHGPPEHYQHAWIMVGKQTNPAVQHARTKALLCARRFAPALPMTTALWHMRHLAKSKEPQSPCASHA